MASFMVAAWECLAKQHASNMWDFPVVFEEMLVLAPVRAERGDSVTLSVSIDKSHRFQVQAQHPSYRAGPTLPREQNSCRCMPCICKCSCRQEI